MAIQVSFYNNRSDNRDMIKDLDVINEDVVCDIYEPCDVINPILIVDKSTIDPISLANYCKIPSFNRDYFITNIVPDNAHRVKLYCHVDVLSTYASQIRYCPLIAARSSNQPNYFLEDNMRLFNTYTYNQYIDIGERVGYPDTSVLITLSYDQQPD